MSDFLDLSSVGGKKQAPPPKKGPGRKPGRGKSRRGLVALVVVAAIAVLAVVLVGGGGDDETEQRETATTPSRYCALIDEFNRLAPNPDPDAEGVDTSPEAVQRQLEQLSVAINGLQADAPSEIRADVSASVTALESAAAGNTAAIQTAAYRESRQRLTTFRQRTCSNDAGNVGD